MFKTFKILSIDGGGIKGLYSARILQEFEQVSGLKAKDCFHMICGTSTGGLIALALSIGKSAAEIVKFYKDYGQKIFPNASKLSYIINIFTKQIFFSCKYSDKNLKNSLIEILGDSRMENSSTYLCIPSYNLNLGRPRVFKKDHHKMNLDNNYLMVDVALATSAAPTFFPIADFDNQYFVDGGVWANNPALCGYFEAIKYFLNNEDGYEKIKLLSVSSLTTKNSWRRNTKRNKSIIGWREKLFELPLNSQSYFTDYFLKNIQNEELEYYRIPTFDNLSSEQEEVIKLDFVSKESLELIEKFGLDMGSQYSKIDDFINCFTKKEL